MNKSWLLLVLVLLFSGFSALAQNQKELESKRKRLFKEIEKTNQLLKETRDIRKSTLNNFYALKKQIEQRQSLINTIQEEIKLTSNRLDFAEDIVNSLSYDVEELQEEYADMAKKAYRMKLKNSELAFLFSSSSVNQAFRRWRYLKQYESYRNKQSKLITDTQEMLLKKSEVLDQKKIEKEKLLQIVISQKNLLESELDEKDELLVKLKNDESSLTKDLSAKRNAHERLGKAIEKVILKALASSDLNDLNKKESKKKRSKKNKASTPIITKHDAKLNEGFSRNKGLLPWPVKHGVVTSKFGTQSHPELKRIKIANNGIDIQTQENEEVIATFDGVVAGMQYIPGNNYMVIVKHGNYFSVYSNLHEVYVKRNETVETGKIIGRVGLERVSNQFELHFEIWNGKSRQNPISWLKRRT